MSVPPPSGEHSSGVVPPAPRSPLASRESLPDNGTTVTHKPGPEETVTLLFPLADVANALAAFLTSLQRQSLNPVQLPQPVVVVQQPQQTAAPLAPSPTPPQQHPFLDSGPLTAFKCGQCINCFRQHNCEKCVNCLARRQPCLRRVCVQSGLIPMHQPQQQGQEGESFVHVLPSPGQLLRHLFCLKSPHHGNLTPNCT